jgi:pilus assembly protein CpaE
MADKIRVLIADDLPETRENVRKLLQFEQDMEVTGHAGSSGEALELARQQRPDIVLMDINMPDVDGITASQRITKAVPETQIIIMSVQSEADYVRRAMLVGARDFLMKPFSGDELVTAVRQVYATRPVAMKPVAVEAVAGEHHLSRSKSRSDEGNIVAVFSPTGGSGCTTIAANLAIALAEQGRKTLLVDGSLQFGDVGVMLNLRSMTSIIDVVERLDELDAELVSTIVTSHASGLEVLLAPPRPEMAELVGEGQVKTMLRELRKMYDVVVVDTSSSLDDTTLAMLDIADRILLIARQNLASLKNISRFYDLTDELAYGTDKILLLVNHGANRLNISVKDIVDTLKHPIGTVIPEDEAALAAADQGRPLMSTAWRRRPATKAISQLAEKLIAQLDQGPEAELVESDGDSRLARLFGR